MRTKLLPPRKATPSKITARGSKKLLQIFHNVGNASPTSQYPCIALSVSMSVEIAAPHAATAMLPETFGQVVKALSHKEPASITLTGMDHPLVCQMMDDYFSRLDQYGAHVSRLQLDGTMLHKQMGMLITYAYLIDRLELFLPPSAAPEHPETDTVPNLLWENLAALRERNFYEQFFPVHMNMAVSSDNLHEMGRHLRFYSRYVKPENIHLNLVNRVSTDRGYFDAKRVISPTTHFAPCPQVFQNLYVLSNGDIAPCCRGKLPLGNIRTHDPDDLINSPELIRIRRMHLAGHMPPGLPCSECEQVDPRILDIFLRYSSVLRDACHHGDEWDEETLQKGFDGFFAAFQNGWPEESVFVEMLRALPREKPVQPRQPRPRPFTVGVFGDSLSLPRGKTWGDIPLAATYAQVAKAALCKSPALADARVLVFSRRSRTLPATVAELERRLAIGAVDIAVLHGGIVDVCPRVFTDEERTNLALLPHQHRAQLVAWAGEHRAELIRGRAQVCRSSLQAYSAALRRACELCLAHGLRGLALLTTAPASAAMEKTSPGLTENIRSYNEALHEVAREYRHKLPLRVIDVHALALRLGPEAVLLADHQHLNREGNRIIGLELADFAAGLAQRGPSMDITK